MGTNAGTPRQPIPKRPNGAIGPSAEINGLPDQNILPILAPADHAHEIGTPLVPEVEIQVPELIHIEGESNNADAWAEDEEMGKGADNEQPVTTHLHQV